MTICKVGSFYRELLTANTSLDSLSSYLQVAKTALLADGNMKCHKVPNKLISMFGFVIDNLGYWFYQ